MILSNWHSTLDLLYFI